MPESVRKQVRDVISDPTVFGRGPVEAFSGQLTVYSWLLDHPDRGMNAWRRLGAQCSQIKEVGKQRFSWTDGNGSEVHWQVVHETPTARIWYAEGSVRPGPLLSTYRIQAVVNMRFGTHLDSLQRTIICHQAEVFFKIDSRAAAFLAHLMGGSAPKLAEQFMAQVEIFFSGITWYLDQHPERGDRLLANAAITNSTER
jgi:hypothetical protein